MNDLPKQAAAPDPATELASDNSPIDPRDFRNALGSYATGVTTARRIQLSKVENRILIGSAATAPASEPDWQEGAIAAGWQAVKSLHERAMRT